MRYTITILLIFLIFNSFSQDKNTNFNLKNEEIKINEFENIFNNLPKYLNTNYPKFKVNLLLNSINLKPLEQNLKQIKFLKKQISQSYYLNSNF